MNTNVEVKTFTSADTVIVAGEGIWSIAIVCVIAGIALIAVGSVHDSIKAIFYYVCGMLALAVPVAFWNSSSCKISYEFSSSGFRVLTRGKSPQEFSWSQVVSVDGPLVSRWHEMKIEMDSEQIFLIKLNFTTLKQAFKILRANVDSHRISYKAPWPST